MTIPGYSATTVTLTFSGIDVPHRQPVHMLPRPIVLQPGAYSLTVCGSGARIRLIDRLWEDRPRR
jgi:hypothetical protein